MGVFRVDAEVAGIAAPDRFVAVEKLIVDTGSEFTWLPEPLLKEAGVTPAKQGGFGASGDSHYVLPVTALPQGHMLPW